MMNVTSFVVSDVEESREDDFFHPTKDNNLTMASTTLAARIHTSINTDETEISKLAERFNEITWPGICLIIIFCIFIVITVIGNTLIILAVMTTRRLRTVTNCFVMSLAIADFLVGLAVMPPAVAVHLIGSWQLGWIVCDIWISLDVLLCTASILSLCAISVDRYLAVTQPLTYSRKRRSKRLALIMILIVWILALAITCPPMLGWYEQGRREDDMECRYNQNEGYVIFSAMGSFFIPMAVMIYVYARISCVVASRHDNMTDIGIHDQKCRRRNQHTTDVDLDPDADTSEMDNPSPNVKKQAARTLSNRSIITTGRSCDIKSFPNSHTELVTQCNKNGGGDYELSSSCGSTHTSSFRTHQSQLQQKQQQHTVLKPLTKSASTIDHWFSTTTLTTTMATPSQGHRYSVRHQHHHVTAATTVPTTPPTAVSLCNESCARSTRVHQKSLSNRITSLKRENKTSQTLSIVVGGFILCWLPFFICYLIKPFLPHDYISPQLFEVLTWVGWINSAINPFIYAFYSVDFRAAFWRLTLKRFFKNGSKGQFPSNTMSIRR